MNMALVSVLFAAVFGLANSIWVISAESVDALGIIINLSMSPSQISTYGVMELSIAFIPIFLFQILQGSVIYRHFSVAAIYYFSRCTRRRSWFIKECLKVMPVAFIYSLIYFGSGLCLGLVNENMTFSHGFARMFLIQVLLYCLYLFATSIIVNILSILLGSYKGFAVVAVAQMLLISAFLLWENVDDYSLLPLNPVSHLFVSWHSSGDASINAQINVFNISFPFWSSFAFLCLLSAIAVALGAEIVTRVEILGDSDA